MKKNKFGPISSQFISSEKVKNRFCIGKCSATALSGFLAGTIITCMVWYFVIEVFLR